MSKQRKKNTYDGNAIKQLRKSLGVTQTVFATLINAPVATVKMWEGGYTQPTTYTMFLLQEYVSKVLINRMEDINNETTKK